MGLKYFRMGLLEPTVLGRALAAWRPGWSLEGSSRLCNKSRLQAKEKARGLRGTLQGLGFFLCQVGGDAGP